MGESFSRFVLSGQVVRPYPDERRNRWLTGTGLVCHEMLPEPFRGMEFAALTPTPDSPKFEIGRLTPAPAPGSVGIQVGY